MRRILLLKLIVEVTLGVSFILIAFLVLAFGSEGTAARYAVLPSATDAVQNEKLQQIEKRLDRLETSGLGLLAAAAGGFGTTGVMSARALRHVRKNEG